MKRKLFVLILIGCTLLFTVCACDSKAETEGDTDVPEATAAYLLDKVTEPSPGAIGGDWIIIGLARSDYDVPQSYYDSYYESVVKKVKSCEGILDEVKYTEYSRTVLALTAIGKDPANVGGYNLLIPLGDFDKTVQQGINGPIWALIAVDSGNYEIPANADATTQATRDMYLDQILNNQLSDGGFSLSSGEGDTASVDITAMALTALSSYTDRAEVAAAVEKALNCLSSLQDENGGFVSYGEENVESDAQVLVALSSLDIAVDDERFIKNGKTVKDNLLSMRLEDGSFCHTLSIGTADMMATEQAFYALVAGERQEKGLSSLYRMAE